MTMRGAAPRGGRSCMDLLVGSVGAVLAAAWRLLRWRPLPQLSAEVAAEAEAAGRSLGAADADAELDNDNDAHLDDTKNEDGNKNTNGNTNGNTNDRQRRPSRRSLRIRRQDASSSSAAAAATDSDSASTDSTADVLALMLADAHGASRSSGGTTTTTTITTTMRRRKSRALMTPPGPPFTSTDGYASSSSSMPPSPLSITHPSPSIISKITRKKKTLVLDLDETLIHSTSRGSRRHDFMVELLMDKHVCLYYVYKRPYVDLFLRKVAEWFKIVIFTASMPEYADPVIDWLDTNRTIISKRYFRQSCTPRDRGFMKNLGLVEPDLSQVFLIDNSAMSYALNPDNGIPIVTWIDDAQDEALLDLLPFLDALRFSEDVRSVLSLRM